VVTPACVVLPTDFEVFDLFYMTGKDEYLGYPIADADKAERFARMRRVLKTLLGDGKKRIGNEGHTICNSAWGDLFDIVYADVPEAALGKYDLLIDLDGTLAQRTSGRHRYRHPGEGGQQTGSFCKHPPMRKLEGCPSAADGGRTVWHSGVSGT